MVHPYMVLVHFLVLAHYSTERVGIFLGLTPNTAINGDMGWSMPQQKYWNCVIRHWCKLTNMNNTLLTKIIFTACSQMASSRCKTWFYRVEQLFVSIDHAYF